MRTFGHYQFGNNKKGQPENVEIMGGDDGRKGVFPPAITTACPPEQFGPGLARTGSEEKDEHGLFTVGLITKLTNLRENQLDCRNAFPGFYDYLLLPLPIL